MGRGKSSAAIRYMKQYMGKRCFLYITPYLSEVDRVCDLCDFEEPDCDFMSKSLRLKEMMRKRANIASTHSLFSLMDDEALLLARENGYSLIIDESIQVIQSVKVSSKDMDILMGSLIDVGDGGAVSWLDEDYSGKFSGYKEMADAGTLYYCSGTLCEVMDPKKFLVFDEVFMLTYMFDGQIQRAYFDFYGFDYSVVGVETDADGYYFSDRPDSPPPIDYSGMIHIIGEKNGSYDSKINDIGYNRTALSANWFKQRGKSHQDIKVLRNNLRNFFDRKTASRSNTRLWTTFKENGSWLFGPKNRYASNFLSLNARATNAYKEADCVAYLANRFINPNVGKFFAQKNIQIDSDRLALSEMLQFIWRSAIRDDKEIFLYMPSRRMRGLLTDWIRNTSYGGNNSGNTSI